ncbi:MAG: PEP-CTERM sorting domain-containing protein [Desulfobacterales bacterium]|jgi:hypothetical protein|nr:PEP-CTERM sorting domain-containing protein [Desulfobacterales bacterium]
MKKLFGFLLIFLFTVGLLTNSASAQSILSPGDLNEIFFQDVELLFDGEGNQVDLGNPDVIQNRELQVGDVFMGIINAQNVDVNSSPFWQYDSIAPDAVNLSGIFAQQVTAVDAATGLVFLTNTTIFDFTLLDTTTLDISPYLNPGEMLALYVDTDKDGAFTAYNTNGTVQEDVADATDSDSGAVWLTAGVAGLDDYAYSYATLGVLLGEFSAEAYAGLSVIQNNTGFLGFELVNDAGEDLFDTFVQVAFTSEIEENNGFVQGNSPWHLASNDPAIMLPTVPEPGTVLLLGLGLLGLSVIARKKKTA